MTIEASVDYDGQHGPIVTVTIYGKKVSVYLASETGVLTTDDGQAGIEVKGPWRKFWQAVRICAELENE